MSYHVPVSPCPLLLDPPFVILLVWLSLAIGHGTLRVLGVPLSELPRLDRSLLRIAVGLGLLEYLPFLLGMSGRLTPTSIKFGLVVLILLFGRQMLTLAKTGYRDLAYLRKLRLRPWITLCMVALAIPLALAFIQALLPPSDPDGLGYHLTAPKRWLQWGNLGYLPTLTHTNSPMGVEMLYTLALAVWSDTATKLIHYALGVLCLAVIFALGRRYGGGTVGFVAAAFWLLGAHKEDVLQQFSWAYVDLGLTFNVLSSLLAWRIWQQNKTTAWLYCAALCAGFAACCKLTGLFCVVSLAIALLVELLRDGNRRQASGRLRLWQLATFIGLAVLMVLPWLWRSWVQTGNPFCPLLTNLFRTRDWSPETAAVLETYMRYYNWGESLSRSVSLQHRMAIRVVAMLAVALVGGWLYCRQRDAGLRALLLITSVLIVLFVWATGLYLRFLIPTFALVYLLLFSACARGLTQNQRLQIAVALFLCVRSLQFARQEVQDLPFAIQAALGRAPRDSYLASNEVGLFRIWHYANHNLPPNARIIAAALNRCQGWCNAATYYSDRFCFACDGWEQDRFRHDTWDHFLSDIRRDKLEYLVCMTGEYYTHEAPDAIVIQNDFLFARRLAQEYGNRLYAYGGYELYHLRLPGTP
jgi:hypothetical protein